MAAIDGIKIFAMNDCDWYAAATEGEALKEMAANLCFDDPEECRAEHCVDGSIVELSDEDLDRLIFLDEDDTGEDVDRRSFRAQLEKMIVDGAKFPCMFASTEY